MATNAYPAVMAEALVSGQYYVCTIVSGPDAAQMYTVRFSNGAEQQMPASAVRMNAASSPPAQPVTAFVAAQPAAAVVAAPTAAAVAVSPRFIAGEQVEALFRGNWFAAKIVSANTNGTYRVNFVKSKTFDTLPDTKIRKKNTAKTIVTTTTVRTPTSRTSGVGTAVAEIDSGIQCVSNFFGGTSRKSTTQTVTVTKSNPVAAAVAAPVVMIAPPPANAPVATASYPNDPAYGKAPLCNTPVASASYPTPAPVVASYPVPNSATGIYPPIAPATTYPAISPVAAVSPAAPAYVAAPVVVVAPAYVAAPAAVVVAQTPKKFKVVTTTTTKIVNGKKIITKTTKKIPISPAPKKRVTTTTTTTRGAAPRRKYTPKKKGSVTTTTVVKKKTQNKFNVVVPAGYGPGQTITIATPNGKQATIAIPAGVYAGQSFQVTMS